MTKEELDKEAKQSYLDNTYEMQWCEEGDFDYTRGYLAGAEPREKQIEIDAEQIRALQKDKGELTDKVKELKAQNEEIENYFVESAGYARDKVRNFMDIVNKALKQKGERIAELEAQIEKMKNCKNCNKLKKEKDGLLVCTVGSFYTNVFGKNCDKWEIKENE